MQPKTGLVAAVVALAAGDVVEHHDAITRLELADSLTYRCHDARCLVSEDARRGVRAAGNFLEIGSADAASVHPNQQLARTDLRHGHGFHPNVVDPAIDRRVHGGRDRQLGFFDRELSGDCHELADYL